MTEYGYSVFAGRPEVDIEGALFNADTVGAFLSLGGAKPYLYGYEPNYLQDELKCSWGNLMLGVGVAQRIISGAMARCHRSEGSYQLSFHPHAG